ncbi:MAG: NUDIX hydrolase [Candidatus Dormibacteraceae bacterium]
MPDIARRQAGRIVLLDEANRILLFSLKTAKFTGGRPVWITPGGGLTDGETFAMAAQRELREETGLRSELGPHIWTWERYDPIQQRVLDERFFLVRVAEHTVDISGMEPDEQIEAGEFRWWSLVEIATSADLFAPASLYSLLHALVSDDVAGTPTRIGR